MNKRIKYLIIILIIGAIALMVHQYLNWGMWFNVKDYHHEDLIIMFFAIAIILYIIYRKG